MAFGYTTAFATQPQGGDALCPPGHPGGSVPRSTLSSMLEGIAGVR